MLQEKWRKLRTLAPGSRFQTVHREHKHAPAWSKALVICAAAMSFGVGVLLTILPGPAFVFFGVAAALVAIESARVARALDRTELWLRSKATRFKAWRARRKQRRRGRSHAATSARASNRSPDP